MHLASHHMKHRDLLRAHGIVGKQIPPPSQACLSLLSIHGTILTSGISEQSDFEVSSQLPRTFGEPFHWFGKRQTLPLEAAVQSVPTTPTMLVISLCFSRLQARCDASAIRLPPLYIVANCQMLNGCSPPFPSLSTPKQYWGDHFVSPLRDLLEQACIERDVADCEFFINKRDYPQLKYNPHSLKPVEPYGFIYDKDDRHGASK